MAVRTLLALFLLIAFPQSVKAHDNHRLNIPQSFINIFLQNEEEYDGFFQELLSLIVGELAQDLGHSLGEEIIVNHLQLEMNQIEEELDIDLNSLAPPITNDIMYEIFHNAVEFNVEFTNEEIINPLHFFASQFVQLITPIITPHLVEPLLDQLSGLSEAQQVGVISPLLQVIVPSQIAQLLIQILPRLIAFYIHEHNMDCS